jgi:hypothetical protein
MQLQNNFTWDDAPVSLNYGVSIKHHSLLHSNLTRINPLSGISTCRVDTEQTPVIANEQVLEEANA